MGQDRSGSRRAVCARRARLDRFLKRQASTNSQSETFSQSKLSYLCACCFERDILTPICTLHNPAQIRFASMMPPSLFSRISVPQVPPSARSAVRDPTAAQRVCALVHVCEVYTHSSLSICEQ